MSLNMYDSEESVLDKIKEVYPDIKVYEDDIPQDDSLEYDDRGTLVPYILVEWGDLTRMRADRGLVSVRQDSYLYFFTVTVATGRANDTKKLNGHLVDSLVGYRPVDGGEITPKGTMKFSLSTTTNRPVQYFRSTTFQFVTNLSWELW